MKYKKKNKKAKKGFKTNKNLQSHELVEKAKLYCRTGDSLRAQGKLEESLKSYQQAIDLIPNYAEAFGNMGLVFQDLKQFDNALKCYKKVLEIIPNCVPAYGNIAHLYKSQNKFEESITYFQKALEIAPNSVQLNNDLKAVLLAYIKIEANNPEIYSTLAYVFFKQQNFEVALKYLEKALELKPNFSQALRYKGLVLTAQNKLKESIDYYQQAFDANFDKTSADSEIALRFKALALLKAGYFKEGWQTYENRRIKSQLNPNALWTGVPLENKRLLVHWEQGFGDSLQFIRYLPLLKQNQACTIIFACQKDLFSLFQNVQGIDELIVSNLNEKPKVKYDFWVRLLSLPYIFETTLNNIPAPVPYLSVNKNKIAEWKPRFSDAHFNVGIVWAGSSLHPNDYNRSCDLAYFSELSQIQGVKLYSLQKGEAAKQIDFQSISLINLENELKDFTDTAAVIDCLDLLISVDTAVVHLAGAMGKPVWLLLPFAPDWRWMLNREDSPWYPTLRLFRQSELGNWKSVFNQVVEALNEKLGIIENTLNLPKPAKKTLTADSVEKAKFHCRTGDSLRNQGKLEESLKFYQQAIDLMPNYAEAIGNMGLVFQDLKQFDNALKCYKKVLDIIPNCMPAYGNIANLFKSQNKFDESITYFQKALKIAPNNAQLNNDLGEVLFKQDDFELALQYFLNAFKLQPKNVDVLINITLTLERQNRFEEALIYCEKILQIEHNYSIIFKKSYILLRLGHLKAGWQFYEIRLKTRKDFMVPSTPKTYWDGSPLNGKRLLVHWEQGLGDTFQFIRYLHLLKQNQDCTIIFACQKNLIPLLQNFQGIDVLIEGYVKKEPPVNYDVWISLLSLPYIFETDLNTIPQNIPYLFTNKDKIAEWKPRFSDAHFNVGIVWAGSATHKNDQYRSCNLAYFSELSQIQGVKLYSLQKGEAVKQIDSQSISLINLENELKDFTDTAAVIECLDLVISVDTAVAHLAGAMGKPVWLLLSFSPDWRWMLNREDSPWYPTMRLFRQATFKDWKSVFINIIIALFQEIKNFSYSDIFNLAQFEKIFNRYGNDFYKKNQLAMAITCYQQVLLINPNSFAAHSNLGSVFWAQKKLTEALNYYQQALRIRPDSPEVYNNMGSALYFQNKLDEALESYQQALRLQPNNAEFHKNIGVVFSSQNKLETALIYYQKALAIDSNYAEAYFDKALALLKIGDFNQGWRDYEWRFTSKKVKPIALKKAFWNGNPLNGKRLLVHWEQGFGDIFQFIRYLHLLKQNQQGTIIFACQKDLFSLFQNLQSIDELIINSRKEPNIDYDFWIPLLSLPYVFKTDLNTIPNNVPYLFADKNKIAEWKPRFSNAHFNIGIVWAGSSTHIDDSNRSCDLAYFLELSKIQRVKLYSLQKGEEAKQIDSQSIPLINLENELKDFTDTAAVIECLDLVISVDTAVAHLAGAMGKSVWLLLPFSPDWRWMLDRGDSPWYPTMRLFRQATFKDWKSVFNQVVKVLNDKLNQQVKYPESNLPAIPIADAKIYKEKADALHKEGKLEESLKSYQQAIDLIPNYAEAFGNMGLVFQDLKQYDKALKCYEKVLEIIPNCVPAYGNMALTLKNQKKFDESINYFQKALEIAPNDVKLNNDLGDVFFNQGDSDSAQKYFQKALALNPNYLMALNNMAVLLNGQNQLEEALKYYRRALHINPKHSIVIYNQAHTLFTSGRLKDAFKLYEMRLKVEKGSVPTGMTQDKHWDGSPLNGKRLLIHWEQGLGDTIQFVRYLLLLKQNQECTIIFASQKILIPLISNIQDIDELIEGNLTKEPAIQYDTWVSLLSLPYIFETDLDSVPTNIPYIFADRNKVEQWKPRFSKDLFNIGIVWAGNASHKNDHNRSCNLSHFSEIPQIQGIKLYSLQKGEAVKQIDSTSITLINLDKELKDFTDTAAVIECLDLVISVDTAVVHLAGAMGKPVWLLLPFAPDWRWMLNREDSPWYPTLRLFRQSQAKDWNSVFIQVVSALIEALRQKGKLTLSLEKEAEFYKEKGDELRRQEDFEKSLKYYQQAVTLKSDYISAYNNMGVVLQSLEKWEEALKCYQKIIEIDPNYAFAHGNIGNIYKELGELERALEHYYKFLSFKPNSALVYENIANTLLKQKKSDEALINFRQVVNIEPNRIEAHHHIANILQEKNKIVESLESYEKILHIKPNHAYARCNYSFSLLKNRDFQKGWQFYEARREIGKAKNLHLKKVLWNGESLNGKRLLVHWEEGLGDTIQFIRYLPLIKQNQHCTLIFACRKSLFSLFKNFQDIDELIVNFGKEPSLDYDTWIPLLSLPRIFKTDLNTIPANIPYLFVNKDKIAEWKPRFSKDSFNIGIIWAGNTSHKNDHNRSCDLSHFSKIFQIQGVKLYSLQKNKPISSNISLINLDKELKDFADTAAVIECLDLVISVDTAVAHLAGAMGKPVWILLPFAPDWRWMLDREDSPWYPTMRLFRQPKIGDWDSVFTQVFEKLREKIGNTQ